MNEEKLYKNFVGFVEDTIKEKDSHVSFASRLGYKNAVGKLITSILIIENSYEVKSEYCDKLFEMYERLNAFYEKLDIELN